MKSNAAATAVLGRLDGSSRGGGFEAASRRDVGWWLRRILCTQASPDEDGERKAAGDGGSGDGGARTGVFTEKRQLKELFDAIPTLDELHTLEAEGFKAEVILVDGPKDKKLTMLKQRLIMVLVRGLNSNPPAMIKKIAALDPDLVIHQTKECLEGMGAWCQSHHAASGLTERVLKSTISEREAQKQVIEFVKSNIAHKWRFDSNSDLRRSPWLRITLAVLLKGRGVTKSGVRKAKYEEEAKNKVEEKVDLVRAECNAKIEALQDKFTTAIQNMVTKLQSSGLQQ